MGCFLNGGYMRPLNGKITLIVIGIILMVGTVDVFAVEAVTSKLSVVKQLGQDSDFQKTGQVVLPNSQFWGEAGQQDGISYRLLKSKTEADLVFVGFDVDGNGLCRSSLILEIFYRDDIKQQEITLTRSRIAIQSRIDFSEDNEYVEIGRLQTEGDGKWKLAHIFLERTPRQMLRAIDGSFRFKILMPKVVIPKSGLRDIPISYVRLISIEHEEFVKLREKERAERGLERIDYKPIKGLVSIPEKAKQAGFVVYPVNYLKLVFPNSAVDYDRSGNELNCFEMPGQAEPVSFVIYTQEGMSDVEVKASDLHSGTATIPAGMINVRRVVYNDQRWGWGRSKRYGVCPDYLSFANPITDIQAGTNCQFWLTINVPKGTRPGLYTGKVTISSKEKPPYHISLSVEVLPIELLDDKVRHMVYRSPFFKSYQKDHISVLQDMKSHGLVPISYPQGSPIKTQAGDLTIRPDGFEHEVRSIKKVYPEAKTIFISLKDSSDIWHKLNGPEPRFQHYFPQFESTYSRMLREYANVARSFGLEPAFTFVDEPGVDLQKRRIAYLCSSIARKAGLKTWVADYVESDKQLPLSVEESGRNINYLRPVSEVVDVFVEAIRLLDENSLKTLQQRNVTVAYYTTYACTSVRPVYNRVLNGLYPFVTNARYVSSYAYRDDNVDPYDDCDLSSAYSNMVGMNDYLLTYPTWKGDILPTLSYEALREGIEDSQLISTLQILADKALQADGADAKNLGKEAEDYMDDMLKRLSKNFKQEYWARHRDLPVDPMEEAILRDLNKGRSENHEIFDKIRRGICDRIIALQSALAQ